MSRELGPPSFRVTRTGQSRERDDSHRLDIPMDGIQDGDHAEPGIEYSSSYFYQQRFVPSTSATYENTNLPPSIQEHWDEQRAASGDNLTLSSNVLDSSTAHDQNFDNLMQQYNETIHAPNEGSYVTSDHYTAQPLRMSRDVNHTTAAMSSDSWYDASEPYAMAEPDEPSFWPSTYHQKLPSEATASHDSSYNTSPPVNATLERPQSNNSLDDGIPLSVTDTTDSSGGIACPHCGKVLHGEYARGNLVRHIRTCHSETVFRCQAKDCPRHYRRSDARAAHYRKSHPELTFPPPISRSSV